MFPAGTAEEAAANIAEEAAANIAAHEDGVAPPGWRWKPGHDRIEP